VSCVCSWPWSTRGLIGRSKMNRLRNARVTRIPFRVLAIVVGLGPCLLTACDVATRNGGTCNSTDKNQLEGWQQMLRDEDPEKRVQALQWFRTNVVKPGATMQDVNGWLGTPFEAAALVNGPGRCYFYGDLRSGVLLFVFYEQQHGDWHVASTEIVRDERGCPHSADCN